MKVTSVFTILASATLVLGQALTINTPLGVPFCLRQIISWNGGTAPYTLTINPGGDVSAAPIKDLGTQTGTSYSWFVDIPAGTSVFLRLRDSTGLTAETAPFTIQPGSSATCTPPSGTATVTPPPATGAPPPSGGGPTTAAPPAGSSSRPAPSGAASTTASSGISNTVQVSALLAGAGALMVYFA